MVDLRRLFRHLTITRSELRSSFAAAVIEAIEAEIRSAERRHGGELRFAVELALPVSALLRNTSPRQRAVEVFSELRVWDTEENSGVLIYVLLADRDVEIVADRGICRHVAPAEWEAICHEMEDHFRRGEFLDGARAGVRRISELLVRHFPPRRENPNELPDRPLVR